MNRSKVRVDKQVLSPRTQSRSSGGGSEEASNLPTPDMALLCTSAVHCHRSPGDDHSEIIHLSKSSVFTIL